MGATGEVILGFIVLKKSKVNRKLTKQSKSFLELGQSL